MNAIRKKIIRAAAIILVAILLLLVACGAAAGGDAQQETQSKVRLIFVERVDNHHLYEEFALEGGYTLRCMGWVAGQGGGLDAGSAPGAGYSCDWP